MNGGNSIFTAQSCFVCAYLNFSCTCPYFSVCTYLHLSALVCTCLYFSVWLATNRHKSSIWSWCVLRPLTPSSIRSKQFLLDSGPSVVLWHSLPVPGIFPPPHAPQPFSENHFIIWIMLGMMTLCERWCSQFRCWGGCWCCLFSTSVMLIWGWSTSMMSLVSGAEKQFWRLALIVIHKLSISSFTWIWSGILFLNLDSDLFV